MLDDVIRNAEVYAASPLPEAVREDDKFFACALASGCKVIISGDKHLLRVSGYHEVEVLKPRDFGNQYLVCVSLLYQRLEVTNP
jgi:predicted nucleic acid-binding protein